MKILIICSAAGGHLSAGLSIADELRSRYRNTEIIFASSDNNMARVLVSKSGFGFYRVYSKGLLRKSVYGIIKFLAGQAVCVAQSAWLLLYLRPKMVISTGGFASTGVVFWSWLFGIPSSIHEQNIIPGKANHLLAFFAKKVLVSFDETKECFSKDKCSVTGMPIRLKEKYNKKDARERLGIEKERFTVLVTGGSSGAHAINELIAGMMEELREYKDKMQFIHLTGEKDYKKIKTIYAENGITAYVEPFSGVMDIIYSASDLVLSRSGNGTISEIAFYGLPAVLVPYPYSSDKHQLKNAKVLEKSGAAVVVEEEDATPSRILGIISGLLTQPEILTEMARKSAAEVKLSASRRIAEELVELAGAR